MSLPLDARIPPEHLARARAALARAKAVGEEYEGVEVATATVRARRAGEAIVREARRRGVEAIVLAAEEPSRQRGGLLLGGKQGLRDTFVGDTTRYVITKAPCRVILTAPPAGVPGTARRPGSPTRRRPRRRRPRRPRCPWSGRRRGSGTGPTVRSRPGSRCPRTRPGHACAISCAGYAAAPVKLGTVFVLVVGAGRVGSAVATAALRARHTVSVLDEDPLSHERLDIELGRPWEEAGGRFTVGTALELDALVEAGIEEAEVFIASTNGDNTNLVIAQVAQRRFEVPRVIARVLDPRRAAWYREQGVRTISPTEIAIEQLTRAALDGVP